jgi:hypothetical protein
MDNLFGGGEAIDRSSQIFAHIEHRVASQIDVALLAMDGDSKKDRSLTEQQMAICGLTDVGGIRQNNVEDWLELARRGADNFQHFGGRVLALARVIKLTGELVNFVLHVSR